jgi:hypothetical protein
MRGLGVLRRATHNFLDTRGALADIADIELSPKYPPEPRTIPFFVFNPRAHFHGKTSAHIRRQARNNAGANRQGAITSSHNRASEREV